MSVEFESGDQSDGCDIICPHCGYSRQADSCDGDASEDPTTEECDDCGKPFIRYAIISITYCTKKP